MNKEKILKYKNKNQIKIFSSGHSPSENLLRKSLMEIPDINLTNDIPNNIYLNGSKSDMNLLNQKIISQKNNISYLKSRLHNYENSKKEISRLKQEFDKIEESIREKNSIILEFQKLSEITKKKFELYISKTDSKFKEYNNKYTNFPQLQKENNDLNQKIFLLKEENRNLKQKYKEIENKNITELNNAKNEILSLKKNFENIIKENNFILNEKNNNNKEIENLRNKLLVQEEYETELDKNKKKYFLLETKINQKENNIKNLQKINETLEKKIQSTDDNYKRLLSEQRNLREKIKNFEKLCNKYELSFQKIKKQNTSPLYLNSNKNENEINSKYNHHLNYSYSNRNKNPFLKRNRVFYKHNNDNKIIATHDNLRNKFIDYWAMTHNDMNFNNNYNIIGSPKIGNYKFNFLTPKNEVNSRNSKNINVYRNEVNYIQKSNQFLDKSFAYSNYLLNNLKNKISALNFGEEY